MDIGKAGKDTLITILFKKGFGDYKVPILEINLSETLPLTYVIPDSNSVAVLKNGYYKWGYIDNTIRNTAECATRICEGKEIYYISVLGSFTDYSENEHKPVEFGQEVAHASGIVRVAIFGGYETRGIINTEKLLTIGNVLVFVGNK